MYESQLESNKGLLFYVVMMISVNITLKLVRWTRNKVWESQLNDDFLNSYQRPFFQVTYFYFLSRLFIGAIRCLSLSLPVRDRRFLSLMEYSRSTDSFALYTDKDRCVSRSVGLRNLAVRRPHLWLFQPDTLVNLQMTAVVRVEQSDYTGNTHPRSRIQLSINRTTDQRCSDDIQHESRILAIDICWV
jgi:hypothetical protein